MDNKLNTYIRNGLVLVIALVALLFFVRLLMNPGETEADQNSLSGIIDGFFTVTYLALGIALIMALFSWFKELISHPKKAIQFGIAIILFLIVVGIAKGLSSSEPATFGKLKINASTSSWVDTGLYTFYILGAIALLLMFISPVLSMFGTGDNKSINTIEAE